MIKSVRPGAKLKNRVYTSVFRKIIRSARIRSTQSTEKDWKKIFSKTPQSLGLTLRNPPRQFEQIVLVDEPCHAICLQLVAVRLAVLD
jgi:hypothetical protein